MTAIFKNLFLKSARLCKFHNLAFFVIVVFFSCNSTQDNNIKIIWINHKASAIHLPETLFKEIPRDSLTDYLRIILHDSKDSIAILGDLQLKNNIIFEPLLPFSRGSDYEVFYKNKKIGEFSISEADKKDLPELTACYPQQDTLPENLLKIYLAFSHPMSEGHSNEFITVIKNNRDTLQDEFLNLQPELWNEDRTVLTIWFDPGRIKRDLQPNMQLGAPLKESEKYQLIISHKWKDALGVSLQKDFTKLFVTGSRDGLSPNTAHWRLVLPDKNSQGALTVISDEPLDHFLFAECLHIIDERGVMVKGKFEIDSMDNSCHFFPSTKWIAGKYSLIVESRLEDLAGNNLNRPFDRDILLTKEQAFKDSYLIEFLIEGKP